MAMFIHKSCLFLGNIPLDLLRRGAISFLIRHVSLSAWMPRCYWISTSIKKGPVDRFSTLFMFSYCASQNLISWTHLLLSFRFRISCGIPCLCILRDYCLNNVAKLTNYLVSIFGCSRFFALDLHKDGKKEIKERQERTKLHKNI